MRLPKALAFLIIFSQVLAGAHIDWPLPPLPVPLMWLLEADIVAGWMGMTDSRDSANASYPKFHRGLDDGDLFSH
jgi:hypothetical protein